ncbi:hypothetical protein HanRHA438_Chr11g0482561 [Helianthus annuus]|nr:hypothetical protein HanRHA438_Chr11g0482561 [Helianthus annuus]
MVVTASPDLRMGLGLARLLNGWQAGMLLRVLEFLSFGLFFVLTLLLSFLFGLEFM